MMDGLLFVLLLAHSPQSQVSFPAVLERPRSQTAATQAGQPIVNDRRRAQESPLAVGVQPSTPTVSETLQEQRRELVDASAERWAKGLGVTTAVLAFLQFCAIGFQAWIARRQTRISAEQSQLMLRQSATTEAMFAANKAIERAYLSVSFDPPGLRFPHSHAECTINVTNRGNTPARITAIRARAFAVRHPERLPDLPDYERRHVIGPAPAAQARFLVKDDSTQAHIFELIERDTSGSLEKTHTVYLIGYCDYIDAFGDRHRLGWARMYNADADRIDPTTGRMNSDRNNLGAVMYPSAYDYDRPRSLGEGADS